MDAVTESPVLVACAHGTRNPSGRRLIADDARYRCVSEPGELPFEHYLRLENADLPPEAAARRIRDAFGL